MTFYIFVFSILCWLSQLGFHAPWFVWAALVLANAEYLFVKIAKVIAAAVSAR